MGWSSGESHAHHSGFGGRLRWRVEKARLWVNDDNPKEARRGLNRRRVGVARLWVNDDDLEEARHG